NAQREPRRLARDDVLDHQLMRRVCERVNEADRDRLNLFGEERINGALRVGRIERALDRAPMIDALVDYLAQVALDRRLRFGRADVIEARHAQGADLQDVPEPLGGDEADQRALALEDGVGGDRSAVANFFYSRASQTGLRVCPKTSGGITKFSEHE